MIKWQLLGSPAAFVNGRNGGALLPKLVGAMNGSFPNLVAKSG